MTLRTSRNRTMQPTAAPGRFQRVVKILHRAEDPFLDSIAD